MKVSKTISQICKLGTGKSCCKYIGKENGIFVCFKLNKEKKKVIDSLLNHAEGDNCEGKENINDDIDITFEKAMEPGKEYFILNGASSSYDLREEIKSWGGYWDKDHKSWSIENPCDKAKTVLVGAGLKLQFRRNI